MNEQQPMRMRLPEDFDFSPRAIADAKQEIARCLAPFDAVQTLAAIVAFSAFGAPESYSEPDTPPSTRMEYVASVLLERDDPAGLCVMTVEQTSRQAAAIQRALDNADQIGLQTIFNVMSRRDRSDDPLDRIAAHLHLIDAGIRGPGYEHQAKEMLQAAFADAEVEAELERAVGFTARAALALEEELSALVQRRFDRNTATITPIVRHPQEVAFQLQRRGEHILCVAVDELANAANLGPATVESFLTRFSVRFGERRGIHLLTGLSEIRERPLVNVGDGRFLWTSGVNLLWALQPSLEEALKETAAWGRYQARRAAHVEQMTVAALAEAVRGDQSHANVVFSVDGGERYELDGLVIVDDVAFILEAKSGRLNHNARRGRKRELRPALAALVGKASSQALRLARALRERRQVEFFSAEGTPLDVNVAAVCRVETIIVTLEDLAWLSSHGRDLMELRLLDDDTPSPWIVSCFDLETICQTIEFPAQLTLYLEARRKIGTTWTGAAELNLWMVHVLRKLEFPADLDIAMLPGDWTDDLDRYFMFGHGELPKMPLRKHSRREVEAIDRRRDSGHVRAAEAIIAADQDTRPLHGRKLARG